MSTPTFEEKSDFIALKADAVILTDAQMLKGAEVTSTTSVALATNTQLIFRFVCLEFLFTERYWLALSEAARGVRAVVHIGSQFESFSSRRAEA